jgi:hypothetical protein
MLITIYVNIVLKICVMVYIVMWLYIRAAQKWRGKWGNLNQAPATQGPPTNRVFIPNIYYHLAG